MKKVVFKGIVNDKEFDNVNDYNEEMSKLIREGVSISASSSTQLVDEPEKTKEETAEKTVEEDKPTVERYIGILDSILSPYFGEGPYYLDVVSGDEELDKRALEKVKNDLTDAKTRLEKVLDMEHFSLDEALEAMSRYKSIRDNIVEDSYQNETVIRDLEQEIEKDKTKLNTLRSSKPFIKEFLEGYTDLFNSIRQYLLS